MATQNVYKPSNANNLNNQVLTVLFINYCTGSFNRFFVQMSQKKTKSNERACFLKFWCIGLDLLGDIKEFLVEYSRNTSPSASRNCSGPSWVN